MGFRRTCDILASIAVFAIVASATPPEGIVAAAAAPLSYVAEPLSPQDAERLRKLLALTTKKGQIAPMDQSMTHAFGFTSGDQRLDVRQYGLPEPPTIKHYFNRTLDDKFFILLRIGSTEARAYLLNPDLTFVTAVKKSSRGLEPLPDSDARAGLLGELRFWYEIIDPVRI